VQLCCTGHAVVLRDLPTLDELCAAHLKEGRRGGRAGQSRGDGHSAEESQRRMEDLLRFGMYFGRIVHLAKVPVLCEACGEGIRPGSLMASWYSVDADAEDGEDGGARPGFRHPGCAVDAEWWAGCKMPSDVPTHSASCTYPAPAVGDEDPDVCAAQG